MGKIKQVFYKLNNVKGINTRIVLLSDIHYYNKQEKFKLDMIFDKVKYIKPDYICISGDLIDESYIYDKEIIYNWIKKLGNIAKVIIGIGNHELLVKESFETGFDKELFDKINMLPNVTVLDNTSIAINNICFMGITYKASHYYLDYELESQFLDGINNKFKIINKNNYNILLCHSPLNISKKDVLDKILINNDLDLVLCGHTHGGITPDFLKPILKGVGLISPFRKIFFKHAYGLIRNNKTNIIISSGITKASHRNRFHFLDQFFNREITIIDITAK